MDGVLPAFSGDIDQESRSERCLSARPQLRQQGPLGGRRSRTLMASDICVNVPRERSVYRALAVLVVIAARRFIQGFRTGERQTRQRWSGGVMPPGSIENANDSGVPQIVSVFRFQPVVLGPAIEHHDLGGPLAALDGPACRKSPLMTLADPRRAQGSSLPIRS